MNHSRVCVLFSLSLLLACCQQRQTDRITFANRDSVSSYGPNTMVRNVKQAKNGNILISASRAGVFRYDGKAFTNLASQIGSRRFWDVLEDQHGDLWFTTTDSGVYRYSTKCLSTGQAAIQQFTTREGLASNGVGAVYEDKSGIIWFATGGGLSRFDGTSFQNFTTNDGLPANDITTIMEAKTGKFWIGTRGYLSVYDGKTFTTPVTKDGKTFYNVWSIVENRTGTIWFGGSIIKGRKGKVLFTDGGFWRYDGKTFTKVSQRGASFIIDDKKGNIWTTGSVSPPNGSVWALSRYDQKTLYTNEPAVTEIMSINGPGMLCGILEAYDGSIWFGGLGAANGVYRYDGKTVTDFRHNENQHKLIQP